MNIINKQKFINLYDSNLNAVFRFCYLRTSDRDLSMDIAQQAFLKTWVYVKTSDSEIKNIRALVYRIAQNLIIDWYRKRKEESLDKLQDENGFNPSNDGDVEGETETELTLKMLDELSDSDKEIITLRYINNLKPKEIAEILDEDVNVVSVRIHRAKNKLKSVINKNKYGLF